MKISKQLIKKSANKLSIAKASVAPMLNIELIDNTIAIVEGAKTILEYTENSIKLSAGRLIVCFEGSGLNMRSMNEERSVVQGKISGVLFS